GSPRRRLGRWMMADAGLLISWRSIARGREQRAFQLFGEIVLYFSKMQQEGLIEGFEPVLLDPQPDTPMGLVLLRGEAETLHRLQGLEDFQLLLVRASLIVDGLAVVPGRIGAGLG